MNLSKDFHFHRRNLPHIYALNLTYFITFRLKGSFPINKITELRNTKKFLIQPKTREEKYIRDKRFFSEYDNLLHKYYKKVNYLSIPNIANILVEQLHKPDSIDYELICYSIMPNHVHLVFTLIENSRSIDKIMQSMKRLSAYYSNQVLRREGSFWQAESYDHIVRDEKELQRIIKYTLLNPVKAGLVENWEDWDYNYLKQ